MLVANNQWDKVEWKPVNKRDTIRLDWNMKEIMKCEDKLVMGNVMNYLKVYTSRLLGANEKKQEWPQSG